MARWAVPVAAVVLFVVAFSTRPAQAHKAVTSKYSFTKDVFPVLRDNCGRCHVAGGPAPMSLLTYKDAVAWAEAERDELTAERMPPWPTDPLGPEIKGAHPISSHDLNVIVTWASGGTPIGDLNAVLPTTTFEQSWKLGTPDVKIAMDAPHTVAPGSLEETCDFTLPTGITETKWVKAADLMPSAPAIARDATISVENGPVLAVWQPGSDALAAPAGAAFKLPAGAKLHLQIHYKKHFDVEQEAVSDKSTIGLYFTDPPAGGRELQSFAVDGPKDGSASAAPATFTNAAPSSARILAIRPLLDRPYASVVVDAVSPNGSRVTLLKLRGARPQWFRRYWLQAPVDIPAGAKIEVAVAPLPPNDDEPKVAQRFALQVAVDYVPQ
jgi:hypothetical protein